MKHKNTSHWKANKKQAEDPLSIHTNNHDESLDLQERDIGTGTDEQVCKNGSKQHLLRGAGRNKAANLHERKITWNSKWKPAENFHGLGEVWVETMLRHWKVVKDGGVYVMSFEECWGEGPTEKGTARQQNGSQQGSWKQTWEDFHRFPIVIVCHSQHEVNSLFAHLCTYCPDTVQRIGFGPRCRIGKWSFDRRLVSN
jgi:hypothetical protein